MVGTTGVTRFTVDTRRGRPCRRGARGGGHAGPGACAWGCCLSLWPPTCPLAFVLLGEGLEDMPALGFSLLTAGGSSYRHPVLCRGK